MIHEESDTKSTHEMRARSSSNPAEDLQWVSPAHQNTLPRRELNNSSAESAAALLKSNNENNLRLWATYIPKLVNTFCMPEVGEEKTVSRQEVGREREARERESFVVCKNFSTVISYEMHHRASTPSMPRACLPARSLPSSKLAMKERKWKSCVEGFRDAQTTDSVVKLCSRHGS